MTQHHLNIEKTTTFPLDYGVAFVINMVIIHVWLCLQILTSVPLIRLFILAPIPPCLTYYI